MCFGLDATGWSGVQGQVVVGKEGSAPGEVRYGASAPCMHVPPRFVIGQPSLGDRRAGGWVACVGKLKPALTYVSISDRTRAGHHDWQTMI